MLKPKTTKSELVAGPLRSRIRANAFPRGSRLPGVREVAATFGVSPSTVTTALKALEREGLVECKTGSGVFVKVGEDTLQPSTQPIESSRGKAGQIADQLCRDISLGSYRVGEPLPSRKVLRHRMQTSPVSLNAALKEVEERGLVHRLGNLVVVGAPEVERNRSKSKVFRVPALGANNEIIWDGRLPDFFHFIFQKELSNHGASFGSRNELHDSVNWANPGPFLADGLGCVYPVAGLSWVETVTQKNEALLEKEMARLDRIGLPVLLFPYAHIFNSFPKYSFRKHRHLFPFGIDNFGMGRKASQYLAVMGHERVAFFSYSDDAWNKARIEGVNLGLHEALGRKVEVAGFHGNVNKFSLRKERSPNREEIDRDLRRIIHSWYPNTGFSGGSSSLRIAGMIHDVVSSDHHTIVLRPLFEEALASPDITAWVGSDPTVTLAAKRFLAENKSRQQHPISLLSLDDNSNLSAQAITACNPEQDRMGYLAAHCLLGDIPIRKDKRGVVECAPRIVDRGSVARVSE